MKRKKHNVPTVDNIIGNFAGRPVRVIIVVVSLIAIIFPLYWLLTSSVKIEAEYLSNPPVIFPSKFTAASYQEIFGKDQLWLNFFNTVVVAGASTIISVIFGSMAAYAVARGSLGKRARKYFGLWFMVQKMYPAIATAIPVYLVMRTMHLIDTKTALIIMNTPKILVVAPAPIEKECEQSHVAGEMGICADKSKELAAEYEICAKQYGCDFLDAGPFVKMNQIDFMHLDAESHERLAEQIVQVIRKKV